ncbi:MAG TPA: dethiobiotin synthase, partial [Pirellulales bacterium]|nr:dethiobiotin synthase [Pirellulales bacterium]
RRVGVYKPVASGCTVGNGGLVSGDAVTLWEAAGRPESLERVCPQRFRAPLAPHLAARQQGDEVDARLLRDGFAFWVERSEIVLVEGAGGLMSPLTDDEYVADLAYDLGLPLVVVSRNALGTIHQTLATLVVAATFRQGLDVAGVVLNNASPERDDSAETNAAELASRCVPPLVAQVSWGATCFTSPIDWWSLASLRR